MIAKKKVVKNLLSLVLAASVLAACGQPENNLPVNAENESPTEKKVKKHETVNLPVNIYMDSEYAKWTGTENTFTRSITSTEIKDFDEATEIEFFERYDNDVRSQGFDLQKDYKLLIINMAHELIGEKKDADLEAFILNDGSGLVIGDEELNFSNDFLNYQQGFISTDYKVGANTDETGDIFLAIPNEFADNKNLQLKILQKVDDENKNIYINIQH